MLDTTLVIGLLSSVAEVYLGIEETRMEVEELPAACHVDEIVEGLEPPNERPLLPQKDSQHNLFTQIDIHLQFD